MKADGTWVKMKGEVHFGGILGGTAVQDVWMGHQVRFAKAQLFSEGRLDSMIRILMLYVVLGYLL